MFLIMLIYTKDDEEYVAELYIELKGDMLHVANSILHNHDDAEDAVQIAFTKIIKYLQRIQDIQNKHGESGRANAAYCIAIVSNTSRRMYNNRKAKEATPLDDVDYEIASSDNIDETAWQNDLLQSLNVVVNTMPDNLSKPFILRYYKDMKYPEIGKLLNITANAAQKRVERATDIIMKQLNKDKL